MNSLKVLFNWFGKLFSTSGDVSSKRVAFIAVVASAIIWLSCDLHQKGLSEHWVTCFQTLVVTTIGGYVGGCMAEKKQGTKKEPAEGEQ